MGSMPRLKKKDELRYRKGSASELRWRVLVQRRGRQCLPVMQPLSELSPERRVNKKKAKGACMKYFRFSKFFPDADDELLSWMVHFRKKGIGCCLIRRPRRGYAIYREGRGELVDDRPIRIQEDQVRPAEIIQIYDPRRIFSKPETTQKKAATS